MKATKWTHGAHTSSWFDAVNWSQGVPVAGEAVQFLGSRAVAVSLAGAQGAQSGAMTVLGDAVTFSGGTLTTTTQQPSIGYKNDLTVGRGGSVTVAAGATLVSSDALLLGSSVSGTFTSGALNVYGTLDASIINVAQGTALVSGADAHVGLSKGLFVEVGFGTLTLANGGTLDAGPDTLKVFYSDMRVGSGFGNGTVAVTGSGSNLTIGIVYLGYGYNGYLNVTGGGVADVGVIYAGTYGDGTITVSGVGSQLNSVNGVIIGDVNVLPVVSALEITQGGSVSAGYYGLDLHYGRLALDSTASLSGTIVSQVGKIEALAIGSGASVVTLGNDIVLQSNNGAQGQYDHVTSVYADVGATLDLTGVISGASDAILSSGSGHVILANGANSFSAASLYSGTLEIAASGAAGVGVLSFTGMAGRLQIDSGVVFGNTIAGFAHQDMIDVRGFGFGAGVTDSYTNGTLVLTSSAGSDTLSVSGSFTAGSFAFADDHHGGVVVSLVHG